MSNTISSANSDACIPSKLPTGDLSVESSVYEWLVDDDNRELQGALEEVNKHMLSKLVESNPFVAAVFISKEVKGTGLVVAVWLNYH